MENRLIALELVLDGLGLPTKIDTLDDRILLQKSVYLAQASGVDLGYRFSWYVHGPYSTSLAGDYYALRNAVAIGERPSEGKTLLDPVAKKIKNIQPILDVPEQTHLTKRQWMELVSSLHYLKTRVTKGDAEDAKKQIKKLKPHLAEHTTEAETALEHCGFYEIRTPAL